MWTVALFLLELSRLSAAVARAGFAIRIRTVKSHDGIQETMMGMGRLHLAVTYLSRLAGGGPSVMLSSLSAGRCRRNGNANVVDICASRL
jgi:hypothetical protein